MALPQLVLLDRDGVINFDSPDYIKSPEEWRALPGALAAIARLNQAGVRVGICSNQSGVGRGLFDATTLAAIHRKLFDELQAAGGHIDHLGICPHTPEDQCYCRKPQPGLLLDALQRCQGDAAATLFIGDSLRDLQAAAAAGVRGILVRTGNGGATEALLSSQPVTAAAIYDDLGAAVDALLSSGSGALSAQRSP